MGKIIRSTIDFLYVKGNRLSAHKLPMIRSPSGTYYLTYNVTLRQLVSGCLGYAHFSSLSRDNKILKFIISTLKIMKVYNKYYIKPEKLTFCHYNDFL